MAAALTLFTVAKSGKQNVYDPMRSGRSANWRAFIADEAVAAASYGAGRLLGMGIRSVVGSRRFVHALRRPGQALVASWVSVGDVEGVGVGDVRLRWDGH